jgi:hypothetical protein
MNNQNIILLLFILILLSIFIFTYLYHIIKVKIKYRESYTIYLFGKRNTFNIYWELYDFFSQWIVTRHYMKKITSSFKIYNPSEAFDTSVKSMKLALKIWSVDIALMLVIYGRNPSLNTFLLFLIYLLFINQQILYRTYEKGQLLLLKQLDNHLVEVRHNFQNHGMIDEAIFDALDQTSEPMKIHGQKIYDILNSSDIVEEVAKYKEVTPSRFLKLYLSLCVMMITHGDKRTNGCSIFLTNLKYLMQEINIEVQYLERIRHAFSGLIAIALAPLLFLGTIENWAVKSLAEMETYYKSLYGMLTAIIIFLVTYVAYVIITKLKENAEYMEKTPIYLEFLGNISYINRLITPILNKNYGKTLRINALLTKTGEPCTCLQFFIKRILYGLFGFLLTIFLSFSVHWNNKDQLLNNYSQFDYLNSSISKSQVTDIQILMKEYLDFYKDKNIDNSELVEEIKAKESTIKKQYITLIADEILNRLDKYKKEYYYWYELIISLVIGSLFYHIPYLHLLLIKKLRERVMEEEIIQFQTIIVMLIHLERITIETILEWLENFAVIFKVSIEQLRNEIQNGEMEILEEVMQKETYQPFLKIIENLQISDRIGIEKAFDEIELDRINYQEKRKMDNEMNMQDRVTLGKVIAFIPFMITIGLYLILPFLIKGLNTFMGYMEQINVGT